MLRYNSNNGYTGTFTKHKSIIFGWEHYDLHIFRTDTNEVYLHATYKEPITLRELKEQVDNFPEFHKRFSEGK